ncbi:MAG: Holliday junction resolvase RuvX [Flavobacteriales bacterium Tduv]
MSKILGIDYGSKRTGLAVTDPLKIIASGLDTILTQKLMYFLREYLLQEDVEALVVGWPKQLNNQEFPIEASIQKFIDKFHRKYPNINVVRVDERFTSKLASEAMIHSNLKKKQRRNKGIIDLISATIILQSYLDQKKVYDSTDSSL